MEPEQQRRIASKGGKAAHQSGHAHEWDSAEAAEAGRKGGLASHHERGALQPGKGQEETSQTKSTRPPLHEQYVEPKRSREDERWGRGEEEKSPEQDAQQRAESEGEPTSPRSGETTGQEHRG